MPNHNASLIANPAFKFAVLVVACASGHFLLEPFIHVPGLTGWQGAVACVLVAAFLWMTHDLAKRLLGGDKRETRDRGRRA